MRTLKTSGKFFNRGILEALHLGKCRRIFHSADLNITVAVESESRLVNLSFFPTADINIRTGGIPVIFQHHPAYILTIFRKIGIKHLRITDDNLCAFLFMEMNPWYACHFLLQIINVNLFSLIQPFSGTSDSGYLNRSRISAFKSHFLTMYLRPASSKAFREGTAFIDHRKLPGLFCRCFPAAVVKICQ